MLLQPSEAWWNSSWHYSIRVDAGSTPAATNVSISQVSVNFTQQLSQLNSSGTAFLPESLRVIEEGYEVPFDFVNSTQAGDAGNLSWIAEGNVNSTVNRTFYVYFDVSQNGNKPAGKLMMERPNWRSGYLDNMNAYSPNSNDTTGKSPVSWNRSWATAAEVSWNWSTEPFADYAYLFADGAQVSQKSGATSGEIALYQGNGVYSRFTSDGISSYPDYGAADSYGIYGSRVNWVKFLTVRSYSSQPVNKTVAQASAQPTTTTINPLPSRDYNGTVNVSGVVLDGSFAPIYNASVMVRIFLNGGDLKWSSTTLQTNAQGQYSASTQALWDTNGTYSANVTASKDGYSASSNSTTFYYSADSPPSLTLVSVNSTMSGTYIVGWGENLTYAVNVSDLDNHADGINVTLWINSDSGWSSQQTKTATIPNNYTQERLLWNLASVFNYTDISAMTKSYKFEYYDGYHSPANTTSFQGPIVEADDIALEFASGNSSVNRSGTSYIKFEVLLRDSDSGSYLQGQSVSFWNFYSGMAISAGSNSTGATGASAAWVDPTCSSETGIHWWKANYTNSTYYYRSSSSAQFNYTVIGQLGGSLTKPVQGAAYAQGDLVPLEFNLTDECGAPASAQSVNFTVWKSGSPPSYCHSGGANCTWDSTGASAGNYSINVSTSDLFNLPFNSSFADRFTLTTGPPRVIVISAYPQKIPELGSVRINTSLIDQSGSGIASVFANVTLPSGAIFRRQMEPASSSGSTYNYTLAYNSSWGSTSGRGFYNVTVQATDNLGISGAASSNFTAYAQAINATANTLSQSSYSQGQFGSLLVNVTDGGGNPLSGAAFSLSITGPSSTRLYFLSGRTGTTDQYGTAVETPVFVVPSDAPTGTYTINTTATYNESLNGGAILSSSAFRNFTVGGAQSGTLYAKVSVDSRQFLGHDMTVSALVYSSTAPVDPNIMTLSVYFILPNGGLSQWFNVSMSGMNKSSTGIYTLTYPVPNNDAYAMSYLLTLNATSGTLNAVDAAQTRIVKGGPYDVSISPLGEVRQGEYAAFDVNLTNKGDVDNFDVNVSYWFDGNPKTLESVQVNAHNYAVLPNRKVFVPSGTSLGYYNLTVEVVYDSRSAAAYANRPFLVTGGVAPSSPYSSTGGGGVGPSAPSGLTSSFAPASPEKSPKMAIISYPKEILAEKGWIKTESIEINNTGEVDLHEISLSFDGVPAGWIDSKSSYIPALEVGKTQAFRITIAVPVSTKSSSYPLLIKAASREAYDEKNSVIKVFASKAELLLYQMEDLRSRIGTSGKKMAVMEKNGMNVSVAKSLLEDARAQIGFAEKYWNLELYDRTLSIIRDTENIMDSLDYELELVASSFKPQAPAERFPASGLLIGAGVVFLAAIVLMSAWVFRMVRVMDSVLRVRAMSELKNIVLGRKVEIEAVRGDRTKIEWMLSTLEKQYRNGLISKEAYGELKAQNEKKLSNIKAALGP